MKKILLGLMSLAFLASTPAFAREACDCTKKCGQACARGANPDCKCEGCSEGASCKHGKCDR